ncbi:MAG: 23S rRNA (adenine(2030)-N(6))-methyltransferase RlmJ [Acidiferrobacterales bacterium]
MNYRHSYHAGNIADVFKHYVLSLALEALHRKETPFCMIDSHAGAGLYELARGGEHEQGIGQLWAERGDWPALARYLEIVAQLNPGGRLRFYPGSPLIIREFLRAGDRAVLLELHPEEHACLREVMHAIHGISVHHINAWNGIKAFVPPKENRGLVLIDPPYEKPDEFAAVAAALRHGIRHWRNGIYLAWYPIKSRRSVDSFYRSVAAVGVPMHAVEFITLPLDMERRLNGSGLLVINPPWRLLDVLHASLPPLAMRLAGTAGSPQVRLVELNAN